MVILSKLRVNFELYWRRRLFGDLSGYFFGIIRDKASSIIWRYANRCLPVTDCKMNDLEWLFDVKIHFRPALCCRINASFGAHSTAQIWMKIDPYYQWQKCMPMTLVSGNIRFIRIFAGFPWAHQTHRTVLAVVDDGNFWRFIGGYVFENFRDTASNAICYPLSVGNWLQNEWPWVAISCENPFSASTSSIRAFECQK